VGQRDHILVGRFQLSCIRLQLVDEKVTGLENRDTLQRFRSKVHVGQTTFMKSILRAPLKHMWIRQDTEQVDCKGWKRSRK